MVKLGYLEKVIGKIHKNLILVLVAFQAPPPYTTVVPRQGREVRVRVLVTSLVAFSQNQVDVDHLAPYVYRVDLNLLRVSSLDPSRTLDA